METGGILGDCLDELGWSPERLARQLNARHGQGTVGATTPYAWLTGRVPRGRLPFQVASLLTEVLDRPVLATDLWPKLPAARLTPTDAQSPAGDGKLPVVAEMLPLFRARAADLRKLYLTKGSGHTALLASHELALVGRLITEGRYDGPTGIALCRTFAELSRMITPRFAADETTARVDVIAGGLQLNLSAPQQVVAHLSHPLPDYSIRVRSRRRG